MDELRLKGKYRMVSGIPHKLRLDPETGATVLEPVARGREMALAFAQLDLERLEREVEDSGSEAYARYKADDLAVTRSQRDSCARSIYQRN